MTLHEELRAILDKGGRPMTAAELASEVNQRGVYHKGDGSPVLGSQVRARVAKYPGLFERQGTLIALKDHDHDGASNRAAPQPTTKPVRMTTAPELSARRRELLRILDAIDPQAKQAASEGIGGRIGRLSRAGTIPRHVAACMRTITESRNIVEYGTTTLSPTEAGAVEAAWKVILEWAATRG